MDFVFDNIIFTYPYAILLIIVGIWQLFKTVKEHEWDMNYLSYEIFTNGLFFSIGCIIFGIIIIYFKLKGEW